MSALAARMALAAMLLPFFAVPVTRAASDPAGAAAAKKPKIQEPTDTLVFTNGDRLTGKLVRAVGSDVVFHSDIVGDLTVKWDKIQELKTGTRLAVLEKDIFAKHHIIASSIPRGTLTVEKQLITVYAENGATIPQIPLKNAAYIVDETTLRRQIEGHPGAFSGWNGTI